MIRKVGTDDIRKKRKPKDEETYKVRVAVTLAHYVLVTAKDATEAENLVDDYVHRLINSEDGLDGWWHETSHVNTVFEVEEAD